MNGAYVVVFEVSKIKIKQPYHYGHRLVRKEKRPKKEKIIQVKNKQSAKFVNTPLSLSSHDVQINNELDKNSLVSLKEHNKPTRDAGRRAGRMHP